MLNRIISPLNYAFRQIAIPLAGFMILPFLVQAQNFENSLLWKVEGAKIHTSYIFGTIHLIPQVDFELKPKVQEAFKASELLVMELDLTDPTIQMEMMQHAVMKDGQSLDKLFEAHDYAAVDSILKMSAGLSLMMINNFKPFVISTLLTGRMIEGEPASFELVLSEMAAERQMKTRGLETVADQMAVFDNISYQSQVKDVLDMIRNESEMQMHYAKLVTLYKNEQINKLYNNTIDQIDDARETELLIHERNKLWIDKIEKYVADESAFIAVGAAHLGGESGLISLLREAGYRVTPVAPAN